jgi:hypothetical protein
LSRQRAKGTEPFQVLQRKVLARRFAFGLLRPFSGMNSSVRLGEIAQTILSHWPVKPLPTKAPAGFCYLTICGRAHWLMLRESLLSLYYAWNALPEIVVISDGSWTEQEFSSVFEWWPRKINVLSREDICRKACSAGEVELASYAEASPYGLKLASIVLLAETEPLLFVDADILWFDDPGEMLGPTSDWSKPRGIRESNCYQDKPMATRHCPQVLNPPFVNGGILALHGKLLQSELLRTMVREALIQPKNGAFEQTIIAAGVKLGGGIFPEKLCLVEFDDITKFSHRNMLKEGFCSRHYVNWMRHLLYRDAFRNRLMTPFHRWGSSKSFETRK